MAASLPRASVVVASRQRPEALALCLAALGQQDHPAFEIIVVADAGGLAVARACGLRVKLVACEEANLSLARNLGLAQSAGEVVAFIDDDAVAEPSWLSRLVAPLGEPGVVAATGFVRGRNGISYQWRGIEVDNLGQDHDLPAHEDGLRRAAQARRAVKLLGTNMAFRREVLASVGGFDPAMRFYLEDADISLRLAGPHGITALVPLAEVQHGFAASERRRADRVPLSLHEIAASTVVFLRRHAGEAALGPGLVALKASEGERVARHRKAGRITEVEGAALMASLEAGWQDGLGRGVAKLRETGSAQAEFAPLPATRAHHGKIIGGWFWQRRTLLARAEAARRQGLIVTVICLRPSMRAHRMWFDLRGFWWQEGGLFGRSDRGQPWFRWWRKGARIAAESQRLARVRPVQ